MTTNYEIERQQLTDQSSNMIYNSCEKKGETK